ncbi:ABC transporter permease [Lentilactobacillus parafarraginis]|uniref:ABC superfamily ATP binding cassette transporter, membrane protein n=3 Tax=Lentilactobacillus parafarraginis TaxID=390842 RepID=A0A0R1YRE5_9LACO|nr:ABC transporter permease [Lentilactobacillus parafarraginis]KRM41820.1 hypothetical protein FD47_GL002218 [Lentilactobacillus parafarraginis DSM 18390 = JCM 14109]TLQ18476.1 ABC transporter permease [Lentilactobacillus parafarraginis]
MKRSLQREFYKFYHQRVPLYGAVILLVLMLYTTVSQSGISENVIVHGFGAGQWITIIMVAIASSFVAMEYQNRTIMTLFYKSNNQATIFFAKFLVISLYGGLLTVMSLVVTLIFKMIFVGNHYSWTTIYQQHHLIVGLTLNMVGAVIYMLFIIALAFLLITVIRVNAAVVGIGLAIGFFGAGLSSFMMGAFPGLTAIIKWNPLNMINIIGQLANANDSKFSLLTDSQLIWANLTYVLIFLIVGMVVFKRQRV